MKINAIQRAGSTSAPRPSPDQIEPTTHCCGCACQQNESQGNASQCNENQGIAATPSPLGPVPDGYQISRFFIAEMDCPNEEALIRKKLATTPGIHQLSFQLMQQQLIVVHQPDLQAQIIVDIADIGMQARPLDDKAETDPQPATTKSWWPFALGAISAIAAEASHWLQAPNLLTASFALLAILCCGLQTYRKGWIALRHANFNINALMSIAVTGALCLQQWPEAAMVMVLFALSEWIESKSLDRARQAVQQLMKLAPETAEVHQPDGQWIRQPLRQVKVGALLRVQAGERIGLDGQVEEGCSSVDQAPITGESMPVEKKPGDTVYAGTINQQQRLLIRVANDVQHSTLARMMDAVARAQQSKAPVQRFIDQFARVYTPAVLLLAVLVAILPPLLGSESWQIWIYRALVMLVIACPCALVISTPVTIVSGLATAARQGILIKGGLYLEQGRHLRTLFLDKTGTLTVGKPLLTDQTALIPEWTLNSARIVLPVHQIAASLAMQSSHPVSMALRALDQQEDSSGLTLTDVTALPGLGIEARYLDHKFQLGNHRLIHQLGHCSPALETQINALESQGKTVVLLCDEQQVLALYAVADQLKETSTQALEELRGLGIQPILISGDNEHTVRVIATQAGIAEAYGNQLPEDKLKRIAECCQNGQDKKTLTGMVGDGINDAPALARADLGFAMGALGTDIAMETADVALMDDDLRKLPAFVRLARQTHRILWQNISFALGLKAIFLALTLVGLGTMWMAVFADVGASLLVVANGLRLLRYRI